MTLSNYWIEAKLKSPQHKFVFFKNNWFILDLLEILDGEVITLDLKSIKTEVEFFDKLFLSLKDISKINKIFIDLWINKLYSIEDFQFLWDELIIGDLKIIFKDIDKTPLEIQKIINTLISYRERKIVYILVWDINKYYFYTLFDDLHIREWDDYIVLGI